MTAADDILRALGRVEEGVRKLQEDFRDEKQIAHESRKVIHQRLDEQNEKIGRLDTTAALAGEVDAQVRNELAELREIVDKNQADLAPFVSDMKRMKAIGIGISGLIALGGLTIGGIVAWMGEAAVSAVRSWLRIP